MTTDESALRAATATNLGDDTPRLILADCLQESGIILYKGGRFEPVRAEIASGYVTFEGVIEEITENEGRVVFRVRCNEPVLHTVSE